MNVLLKVANCKLLHLSKILQLQGIWQTFTLINTSAESYCFSCCLVGVFYSNPNLQLLINLIKRFCKRVVYTNYNILSFDELIKEDRPQTLIYIFKFVPESMTKISDFIEKP